MRFRKILAALLIAVTAGSSVALAQVLSQASFRAPWNGYTAQRIPDAYVTIIGQPGTTLVPSSQTATNTSLYNLTIPFAFRFLGTNYAANTVTRVAAAGYISFASPSSPGTPTLAQDANTRLIAPFWSDLQANTVQEGGIYWRVDGPIGARVMTVEWRVMGVTTSQPTRNPGEFQAKLYETSNRIEFFYGPNSINRSQTNTSLGAIIGLKNTGQSNTVGGAEDDSQKFLIFPNPDRVRDTIYVTRTRVGIGAAGQTAENTANWPYTITGLTGVSPWFNYGFPTLNGQRIGFRMTSVTDDVAADQVTFEPSRPGNAFAQGSSFLIRGVFRNLGTNAINNGGVPVTLQILRGNSVIETRTGTAFTVPTGTGATSTVSFVPPIGSSITAIPGTYTARIIVNMSSPTDQDRTNDTLNQTFFVVFPRDVMPDRIIEPVTYTLQTPAVYTLGAGVQVEARFLNLGLLTLNNVRVGYIIRDALCNIIHTSNSVVRGDWAPLEYRDVVFDSWTPVTPGQFYVQVFTDFNEDEQRSNDTLPKYPSCGREFSVRYERELQVREGTLGGVVPFSGGDYPVGRPINVNIAYRNNGITDATNVPSRVVIRDPNGAVVYDRTTTVLTVPGEASGNGTTVYSPFPYFVPTSGPGQYCVTATITDPTDPVVNNNTATWCFNVRPPLAGVIYVGTGERFRTIQEANDSLYYYGVGAPVTFKLVNDVYTVRPDNDNSLRPALDARGDVYGSGPNTMVTWMAAEGKTNVRIILKSPSGTGIIYGQRDTNNPTGYITWDGGVTKNLTFILDTAGNKPPVRAIPFEFAQGASNYTIRNVNIMPASIALGRKDSSMLPIPEFFRSITTFRYMKDDSLRFSAGILVRNSAPSDGQNQNPTQRDTLFNRNNTFEGNVIKNFAYGVVSIGAGPLFRIGNNAYTEYTNQNNRILNNRIDSVTRAGIALVYEQGSEIAGNEITRVINNTAPALGTPHAAGIWVSSGGMIGANATRNRGYSRDLLIQRNKISNLVASTGNAAGIWAETNENVFFEATVYRFPANAATNFRIWNNMMWNYRSTVAGSTMAGIALTMAGDTRIDFVTGGNNIDNNTIFNQAATTTTEYGVVTQRATGTVRNNIISILSPSSNPIGLVLQGPELNQRVVSDYNLFWVPNGSVGALSNLSVTGFNIPSPPTARTLNQWRALSGQDQNSIEGNVTTEFVSTTPGSEDLHIRTTTVGSLANNRGVVIPGMAVDIDTDPRNPGGGTSRPDIGADEFNGVVRNNDLLAEDLIAPSGYRAQSGQFSDAEYVMIDSVVALNGRFRNMGGLPQLSNNVRLSIEYYSPTSSSWIPVASQPSFNQTASFDVAQTRTIEFGNFAPRSLRQFGINDAYFGLNPNVTPLYRIRLTSATDDFLGNNIYEKTLRFYVRRSTRQALVSVENRTTTMPADAIGKSNKLNADTLLAALDSINWERADNSGLEDFDLFDRDRWPKENLNFRPWKTVIWAQGAEPQGLEPEERAALKVMLNSRDMYNRSNLIIAGQDVARIHDVNLDATNGNVSDIEFAQTYLRADYRGNTNPANYSNRVIRGVAINPGRYERIRATGVAGDNPPMPSLLRPTLGEGIARATHHYWEQEFGAYVDSAAGVATSEMNHNVIYYGIDWRHYGRFAFEERSSGAQRLLLSALDFTNQYQGVVPVKVSAFDANQSGRKAVRVEWATASEVEVASLEVERAVIERTEQGVREGVYTLVDRKAPAGTATRGAKYSILDQNVEVGAEYRYRLVSVGLDGSRSVDAMDEVKIIGAGEAAGFVLSLQPNPAREFTTIELRMPEAGKATVKLYDAAGRLVRVLVDRAELQAVSSLELNVRDLASGVYTIAVETSTTSLVQKLNVQK